MGLKCLIVGIGGAVGAICRYLIGFMPGYYHLNFPLGTLCINLVGAFFIGLIAGIAPLGVVSERMQLLLKTGFCGGFTTFSTFSLETCNLLSTGHGLMAAFYACASVLFCLFGVGLGQFAAGHLWG